MACFNLMKAYRSREGRNEATGKWPIVFDARDGYQDEPVYIPCGQCIGCRLEKSRIWALRCMHESQLHDHNCFITLTYNQEYCPTSLQIEDLQKFFKRLRKRVGKVRYFACGEYGEKNQRPHFHIILFGFDFPDRYYWSGSGQARLYRSDILESLWTYGHTLIGECTFESCSYTARYCLKKVNGKKKTEHYVSHETGEILRPEFAVMSRRPGVGLEWFENFKSEVLAHDGMCFMNGVFCKIPRYYRDKAEGEEKDFFLTKSAKGTRFLREHAFKDEYSPDRMQVKEELQKIRSSQLKRSLEFDPTTEPDGSYVELLEDKLNL